MWPARQMDREIEKVKLTVAFRKFADGLKNAAILNMFPCHFNRTILPPIGYELFEETYCPNSRKSFKFQTLYFSLDTVHYFHKLFHTKVVT